jgi:hypothetical protein
MWARIVEIMLGCWLGVSPFVFHHSGEKPLYWIVDWSAATAVIAIGLASYLPRLRHLHLVTCLVGLGLCGYAYLGEPYPTPAALQNHLVLGLLLLMSGLIPNQASQAPVAWRELDQAS